MSGIMKKFIILILLVFLVLSNSILAQDAYYLDKGGPVPLWYVPGKIVVKWVQGLAPEMGTYLGSDPAFDQSIEPETTLYGFFYVWLVPGSEIAGTMERLETNPYVEVANPIFHKANDTGEIVSFDRVMVKFLDSVSRNTIDSLNSLWQVQIADSIPGITNNFMLKVSKATGRSVLEIANIYEQDTQTEFAVPDFLARIVLDSYTPVDPYFYNQYNFHNTGQTGGTPDADIDALEAWEFGLGDTSLIVAVIDAGIESHEDLLYYQLYDGYDYAGDVIFYNTPDNDPSPGDTCFQAPHGMACAGLIAASHNYVGVAGLAPNIKIMPLKILDNYGRGPYDLTSVSILYNAIAHAKVHGAAILSNSWTGDEKKDTSTSDPELKTLKWIIKYVSSTSPVFFSAGNTSSYVRFPANMKEVISVGATNKFDQRWPYSPYYSLADSLDLVAPSGDVNLFGDIWTMDIAGLGGYNPGTGCGGAPLEAYSNNYTRRFGGTSAACPQAAGTAALLMSYDRKSNWRNLATNDYKEVLKHSADDLGPVGWDAEYGYGRLNAMKALVAIARGDINKDGLIALTDIIWLVNYVFDKDRIATGCLSSDPGNCWTPTPHKGLADTNCDGSIGLPDVIYLTNFFYNNPPGSPAPPICYRYDY